MSPKDQVTDISEIISQIPEDPTDEQLMSIEAVRINPGAGTAVIRCHLTHEFRIDVTQESGRGALTAEGWKESVYFSARDFLPALRRMIAEVDEEMAAGRYHQAPPREVLILDGPEPPPDMDIPVLDPRTGSWRDAEY